MTDKNKAQFILEASKSNCQSTKLALSLFPSYFNLLCKNFNGLYFDFSANPNLSNNIIDIDKSSLFSPFSINNYNFPL